MFVDLFVFGFVKVKPEEAEADVDEALTGTDMDAAFDITSVFVALKGVGAFIDIGG